MTEQINDAVATSDLVIDYDALPEITEQIEQRADTHFAALLSDLIEEKGLDLKGSSQGFNVSMAGITAFGIGNARTALQNWASKARRASRTRPAPVVSSDTQIEPGATLDDPEPEPERIAVEPPAEAVNMTFGVALAWMEEGAACAREGWNGKGQFVALQRPSHGSKMRETFIYLNPGDGQLIPWTVSQADILAEDWYVVHKSAKDAA